MSKAISEKIKEMLTPKDLKIFEAAIEKMIEKRVALMEEEIKSKYDELAEEYVCKKVNETIEAEKAKLIESYDGKLKGIEKKVVTKLGSFLDHVITEQISDESIEKLAINEVAYPIVEKIMSVFSENYVEIDTDGDATIKEAQKRVAELENQLSTAQGKIMESEERLEKSATFLLISEKTEGLTKTQKARVLKMFKTKKFEDVEENIDTFVEMIKESVAPKATIKEEKGTIDEIISEADSIPEEKTVVAESEETDSVETFATKANRYLAD